MINPKFLQTSESPFEIGIFRCLCFMAMAIALNPWAACSREDSHQKEQVTRVASEKKSRSESDVTGLMPGYDLKQPTRIARLPKSLREASDVTAVSATEIAMVQDEKGIIYLYDFNVDKVTQKFKFGPKGDFEGIALANDTMYVLKSDGTLYKIAHWRQDTQAVHTSLNLPTANNEGLCFDPVSGKLLISPKSQWKKQMGGGKHKRPIFAFDPVIGKLSAEPIFVLHTDEMVTFAHTHHLTLPGKWSRKGNFKEKLQFRPAAIAVHPVTGQIFIISARDRVMLSFDREGQITGLSVLDDELFLQPEGLAFLPDGTMIVVNESPKKKPGILLFEWKN